MYTLTLARSSQPFLTLAVPSSRVFGHKFKGQHTKAIDYIKQQAAKWTSRKANFRMFSDHVKIILDGAFFSLNMQVLKLQFRNTIGNKLIRLNPLQALK